MPDDNIPASFGAWLRLLRIEKGLFQTELAERVGMAVITVRKWEHDRLRPSREAAQSLIEILGVPQHLRELFMKKAREPLPRETPKAPPPEPLPAPPSSFPAETTSFTGRIEELSEIGDYLRDQDCRLLTLAGPGGTGKTRLARQAALENHKLYPGGMYFVTLAGIANVEAILPAIASAIKFTFHPGGDPQEALLAHLNDCKPLLLILDNFEHLIAGADLVHQLLIGAASLTVLVTSREILHLPGEWLIEVGGMDYPEAGKTSDFEHYDAIRLFYERARQVKPAFSLKDEQPYVTELCRMVGGNPLALELAAIWTRLLSCKAIVEEVRKTMDFLSAKNAPGWDERHRSIRAIFEQSWRRLTPDEQTIYRRLTVFQGSFTLEAARFVTGADLEVISALLDKCLLATPKSQRYQIHELLHQYATLKLEEAGETATYQARHCHYYTELVENLFPAVVDTRQKQAQAAFTAEIDEIQAAWYYATRYQRADRLLACIETFKWFHTMTSRFSEAEQLFAYAAGHFQPEADDATGQAIRHYIRCIHAWYRFSLGDTGQAFTQYQASLDYLESAVSLESPQGYIALSIGSYLENARGHAAKGHEYALRMLKIAGEEASFYTGNAYYCLGRTARDSANHEQALAYFLAGVQDCEASGVTWGLAHIRLEMGLLLFHLRRYSESLENFRESLELFRQMNEAWGTSLGLMQVAITTHAAGSTSKTLVYLREALTIARDIQARPIMLSIITEWAFVKFFKNPGRAKQLLMYARDHPISWQDVRDRANKYIVDLNLEHDPRLNVPPETRDLMVVVKELLQEDERDP